MPSTRVYITGATGFIGSHVVKAALEAGYHARPSVRKQSQIQGLKDLFPAHRASLEFEEIPDLTRPNAFQNSFDDVDYVFHLASPMPGKGDDFQTDYVDPAVKDTNAVLDAGSRSGSVKRVIVTSSLLALVLLGQLNATDLQITASQTQKTSHKASRATGLKYHASQDPRPPRHAIPSRASEPPPSQSSPCTLPSFVLGRSLVQTSAAEISGIKALFWASLARPAPQFPSIIVDVRDVAAAHVRAAVVALKQDLAEFIVSAPTAEWEAVASYLEREVPDVEVAWKRPSARAFDGDVSRASEVLVLQWRPVVETVRAVVEQQTGFALSR